MVSHNWLTICFYMTTSILPFASFEKMRQPFDKIKYCIKIYEPANAMSRITEKCEEAG